MTVQKMTVQKNDGPKNKKILTDKRNLSMKIKNISMICAAVTGALTMSANAANQNATATLNAAQMVQGFSSNDINYMLNLNNNTQMKAAKTVKVGNGKTKVRFQQEYKGIPVFGYSIAADRSAMGALSNVSGQIADLDNRMMKTKARISPDQAMHKILGDVKGATNKQNQKFYLIHKGSPRLVHRVSAVIHGVDGPSRPTAFVDAATGEVISQYDNIQFASATGPGGNTKTGQYNHGTDFGAMDVTTSGSNSIMNNTKVKTVNLNHGTTGSTAYSFAGTNNTHKAINGAYSPLNDAHYFGSVVFDMYNAYVGTNPLTFQMVMKVHYSTYYDNAFWDGSAMTFGDGYYAFYPLTSLDISAHEVSHGFTEQNSGLVYDNMSGGINEAFSDMSGEAAEYYMNGTNDWLVGRDITKVDYALRFMNYPGIDGNSIQHADDYYTGQDVHYSSGVYNRAFYLLATTPGWTTQSAFEVMALANQIYWTANSTFDEGACGVEAAAIDKGNNVADVTAAFASVGVTCGGVYDVSNTIENIDMNVKTWKRYTLDVPAGAAEIGATTLGGTGNVTLYLRHIEEATYTLYDCRSKTDNNLETCTVTNPAAGIWHIDVRALKGDDVNDLIIHYGYNN